MEIEYSKPQLRSRKTLAYSTKMEIEGPKIIKGKRQFSSTSFSSNQDILTYSTKKVRLSNKQNQSYHLSKSRKNLHFIT